MFTPAFEYAPFPIAFAACTLPTIRSFSTSDIGDALRTVIGISQIEVVAEPSQLVDSSKNVPVELLSITL